MPQAFLSSALREQAMAEQRGRHLKEAISEKMASNIIGQIAQNESARGIGQMGRKGAVLGRAAAQESSRDVQKSFFEMKQDLAEEEKMLNLITGAATAVGAIGAHLATRGPTEESEFEKQARAAEPDPSFPLDPSSAEMDWLKAQTGAFEAEDALKAMETVSPMVDPSSIVGAPPRAIAESFKLTGGIPAMGGDESSIARKEAQHAKYFEATRHADVREKREALQQAEEGLRESLGPTIPEQEAAQEKAEKEKAFTQNLISTPVDQWSDEQKAFVLKAADIVREKEPAAQVAQKPVPWAEIKDYLIGKGMSENHALGVLANIQAESGFSPGAVGDQGTSFGLFQHHKDRGEAMKNFAGDDWATNWRAQIDFAFTEGAGQGYLNKQFATPEEASEWWTIKFEVPADKEKKAKERALLISRFIESAG